MMHDDERQEFFHIRNMVLECERLIRAVMTSAWNFPSCNLNTGGTGSMHCGLDRPSRELPLRRLQYC